MSKLDDLKFSKSDEWFKFEKNHIILGITDHAQDSLGEVIFFDNAPLGKELKAKESLGSIESVKAVYEIYTPFDAKVLEVNSKIKDNPSVINSDPYGDGWLVKLEVTDQIQDTLLMTHAQYQENLSKSQ